MSTPKEVETEKKFKTWYSKSQVTVHIQLYLSLHHGVDSGDKQRESENLTKEFQFKNKRRGKFSD